MEKTKNLQLNKPDAEDFYNIDDFNQNSEIIDEAIGEQKKSHDDHIADKENPHEVTKEQVELGNVPNVATNDQTPTYTESSSLTTLTSGEKMSVAFGKIKKAVSSLISHIADKVSHITEEERKSWNSKAAGDHKHTKSEITDFPSSLKNPNALSINGKTYDGSSATDVGVMSASYGGTGKTSLIDSSNALINALSTGADTPVDADYYVSQYVNGGTKTTTYHRRPMSALWNYIKSKLSTVATTGSYSDLKNKPNYAGSSSAGGAATSANKLNTNAGSATNPIYFADGIPKACSYSLNKTVPSNAVFTDTNTWRPVQNNLTSYSTSDCLSANQGRLLNDRVATLESTSTKKLTDNSYIRKKGNVVSFYSYGGASNCSVLSSIKLESVYRPPYPIHIAGYICGVGYIRRYPAFLSIGNDGVMGVYFMNQFGEDAIYYTDANWWFDGNGTWLV